MVEKPPNLSDPPAVPKEVVISEDDFLKTFNEFQERSKNATEHRVNAEKMQKLMAMSINAFTNAEHDAQRRRAMNKQQRFWLQLFTRWIVRQQVDEVRKVLKLSPAAMQMEAEQQMKKGGGTLPPI
jgi:hypothetical protein